MRKSIASILFIFIVYFCNVNFVWGETCIEDEDFKKKYTKIQVNYFEKDNTITVNGIESDNVFVILYKNKNFSSENIINVFSKNNNKRIKLDESIDLDSAFVEVNYKEQKECDMSKAYIALKESNGKTTSAAQWTVEKVEKMPVAETNESFTEEDRELDDGGSNLYKKEKIIDTTTQSVKVYANGSGSCTNGSGFAKVNINFKQNISYKFNITTFSLFSGGGIGFSVDYINKLSWETTSINCPMIKVGYEYEDEDGNTKCSYHYVYSDDCPSNNTLNSRKFKVIEDQINNYIKKENDIKNEIKLKFDDSDYNLNKEVKVSICEGLSNEDNSYLAINNCKDSNVLDNIKIYDSKGFVSSAKSNGFKQTIIKAELPNAYINKQTGKVKYVSGVDASLSDTTNYLVEGGKYFLPLGYTNNLFKIDSSIGNINLLQKGKSVIVDYSSKLNVEHKYYNVVNGKNKGYAFTYRTIDLNNVFPNKNAGDNWIDYIRNLEYYVKEKGGKDFIKGKDSSKNLEDYLKEDNDNQTIIMNNTDNAEYMISIDEEATSKITNSSDNYTDNENLEIDGRSKFIKEYNSNFTINAPDGFNKLGCGFKYNGIDKEGDCN